MATGHKCSGCGACKKGKAELPPANPNDISDFTLQRMKEEVGAKFDEALKNCHHGIKDPREECDKVKKGEKCCEETDENYRRRKILEQALAAKSPAE